MFEVPHSELPALTNCAVLACACCCLCLSRPGVASSIVGCRHEETTIDVVKRGERLIDRRPEKRSGRWGYFSAFQVLGDTAWFAASVALDTPLQYGSWIWTDTLGKLDASY